jgi:hypothetical protein
MLARVPALAVALLLPLAGCAGDDSAAVAGAAASSGGSPTGGESPTDPTDPSDPSGDPSEPTDGETTPPGTELAYGDTATVEVETYKVDPDGTQEPGIAQWTVTSVEPGTSEGNGMLSPFRVSVTLTAVTDISGAFILPSLDFEGVDATGEDTIFNVEPGCDDDLEVSALEPGDSVDLCIAMSAFEKGDLTAVRYTGGDAYDEDAGEPIVWKP